MDVTIAERAASLFPPIGSADGWHAEFGRELNATDNRDVMTTGGGVPVVGGRLLEPFVVRLAGAVRTVRDGVESKLLGDRWRRPRLEYLDVACPSYRMTLIAAVLPGACVSTHTVFCLRTPLPLHAQYFLCGLFNSFVVNYLVRLRVSTHVTTAIVEQLPLPRRADGPSAFRSIAALAHRLSRRPSSAARTDATAHLQAAVARLYELSAAEFAHVLRTFPLVERHERDVALAYFSRWPDDPPRGA